MNLDVIIYAEGVDENPKLEVQYLLEDEVVGSIEVYKNGEIRANCFDLEDADYKDSAVDFMMENGGTAIVGDDEKALQLSTSLKGELSFYTNIGENLDSTAWQRLQNFIAERGLEIVFSEDQRMGFEESEKYRM